MKGMLEDIIARILERFEGFWKVWWFSKGDLVVESCLTFELYIA